MASFSSLPAKFKLHEFSACLLRAFLVPCTDIAPRVPRADQACRLLPSAIHFNLGRALLTTMEDAESAGAGPSNGAARSQRRRSLHLARWGPRSLFLLELVPAGQVGARAKRSDSADGSTVLALPALTCHAARVWQLALRHALVSAMLDEFLVELVIYRAGSQRMDL